MIKTGIKRFKEYENEELFLADGNFNSSVEKIDKEIDKGIIMYFSQKNGVPRYIYKPLTMDKAEFNIWEEEMMNQSQEQNLTWIRNIYWKLEEMSCVLVLRNNLWFDCVIYDIRKFWKTIVQERESNFDHRKAKKRIKTEIIEESSCLIRI